MELRLTPPPPLRSPRRLGLLLVEDDASIRLALSDLLADEGFAVTTAVNGREALDELRQSTAARRHRPGPDDAGDGRLGVPGRATLRPDAGRHPAAGDVRRPERQGARDRRRRLRAQADRLPRDAAPAADVVGRAAKQRLAAADRMAALGTLASGIAHEINNPLTYVIANLQTLAERLPRSPDRSARGARRRRGGRARGRASGSGAWSSRCRWCRRPAPGTARDRLATRGAATPPSC